MIYLDHAASAPLLEVAYRAMDDFYQSGIAHANPNAFHRDGKQALAHLEAARRVLAQSLNAETSASPSRIQPRELYFTSGGTESDNLCVMGLAQAVRRRNSARNTVLLFELEHHAITEMAPVLCSLGFHVHTIKATDDLTVDINHLTQLLNEHCVAVVSIMYAHNEVGSVQPIAQCGALAHQAGALMHTDAVQAFGHIPLDLHHVDAASFAAHKLGGPRGIGMIYLKRGVRCEPIIVGGGQERGLRSGTQNVAGAVGFSAASAYMSKHLTEHIHHLHRLRAHLFNQLQMAAYEEPRLRAVPTLRVLEDKTVSEQAVNPGLTHLLLDGNAFHDVVLKLDDFGIAASAGSACASTATTQTHSAPALQRVMKNRLRSNSIHPLRISAGHTNTTEEMEALVHALVCIARHMRAGQGGCQ